MDFLDEHLIMADEEIGAAWDKDERAAAMQLTADEARWLVDYYYTIQDYRIRSANQIKSTKEGEPNLCIRKSFRAVTALEHRIQQAIAFYVKGSGIIGEWLTAVHGIGPVIAGGLLAHIDIARTHYATNIYSFAGLNPAVTWVGREGAARLYKEIADELGAASHEDILAHMCARTGRNMANMMDMMRDDDGDVIMTKEKVISTMALRPWNAKLKTLCWKAGQSFVKTCNSDKSVYGKIYAARKCDEIAANERGDYADQAVSILAKKKIGKTTDAYKAYSVGKLPPAHIQARSERYAVKMFLSHMHTVWRYEAGFGVPPLPYAIEHVAGHSHIVYPPNMDLVPGLQEAIEATWTPDQMGKPRVPRRGE